MNCSQLGRRAFLASGGALLAACAAPRGVVDATEIPAPQWRNGDKWVYRRVDFYTKLPAGTLTRTVVSSEASRIRVVTRDEVGRQLFDDEYESAGVKLSGTFSEDGAITGAVRPPFTLYAFPLRAGQRWHQTLARTGSSGPSNYMTAASQAEGWESVRVGVQDYRALVIRRHVALGYRDALIRDVYRMDLEWYAPAVRGAVMLDTYEQWIPRRRGPTNGGWFIYELESFTPA